jgi:hypothetical protein
MTKNRLPFYSMHPYVRSRPAFWLSTNGLARAHDVWVLLKPEDRREHRKLIKNGNIGYLVKPVRYATLRQQLGLAGNGKQAHAGSVAPGSGPASRRQGA